MYDEDINTEEGQTMKDELPRTIESLYNRHTRYAVTLMVDNKEITRLAFIEKKTKLGLLAVAKDSGEYISSLMTEEELDLDWSYVKKQLLFAEGRVRLAYGKTEREIASEMDLIYDT